MRIRKVKSHDHGNEPCNLCHEDEKMSNSSAIITKKAPFFVIIFFGRIMLFCHDFLVNSKKALDGC